MPTPFVNGGRSRLSEKNVLAIIPARGGSKGLPRKNIRELCGKPLLAYSIEAALKARRIDRVIVSTEDEQIADIARSFGAEVPFLRPARMARDDSGVDQALRYTVDRLEKEEKQRYSTVVTFYPTHPFRAPALVDYLVDKALMGHSPIYTVRKLHHSPFSTFVPVGDGAVVPLHHSNPPDDTTGYCRKLYYRRYGLFTATVSGGVENPFLYVIDDPAALVDIDTLADFYLAEEIINQGLFDFNGPLPQ